MAKKDEPKLQEEKIPKKEKGRVFTYIGGGEDAPRVTKFMGIQEFILGRPTEVTNEQVLRKIVGNPTFVEGEMSVEEIHKLEEKAREDAEAQRAEDRRIDAAYRRQHKTPTKDEQ